MAVQFSKTFPISGYMKLRLAAFEFLHARRETDGMISLGIPHGS